MNAADQNDADHTDDAVHIRRRRADPRAREGI
jgi:hypothetical protein